MLQPTKMSSTSIKQISLNKMSKTTPNVVPNPELKKDVTSLECLDNDKLSDAMFEILTSASVEYQKTTSTSGTKYGREIDLYALVNNDEIGIYEYLQLVRDKYEPPVDITPLKVSVRSAKAKMNQILDLGEMTNILAGAIDAYIIDGKKPEFSIRGVLHGDIHRGEIKKPSPRKKGKFPNNMAVLFRSPYKIDGKQRGIYVRVFKNGSISMTGCKITEDGVAAIKILEQFLKKYPSLFKNKEDQKAFKINNFELTMINSNYFIGFKLDRSRTFDILFNKYPLLFSSYDPDKYAAVKVGFFYNTIKDVQDGICPCTGKTCTLKKTTAGKGTGSGEGQCKKVTIAIFETGNIVITGGRSVTQATAAYTYINSIIRENAKDFALIKITESGSEQFTLTN